MGIPSHKSVTDASFSALKWEYGGTVIRATSSLVIGIVLARLLGPVPFGLVAIAWIVVGFGNLLADVGMGSALVQRRVISDTDVRYAFTLQLCVAITLTAIVWLCAPIMARFFDQPQVVPVIEAMSLVFVLQAFGGIAVSLLKRDLGFKKIQFGRMISYLLGFLVLGVPLAIFGFEVWSLVFAQLTQTALFSLFCYTMVRHPIKPLFSSTSQGLTEFGFKVLLTNIINYLISNMDSFFIGRFFDVVTLGLYNRVYVVVSTPMNSVVTSVQQVTFSAYSKIQGNPPTIRHGYLAGVGFMTMLMLPTFGCVALVPGTVIYGLFGNQWGSAIPFLVPLALAMPFHAVMATGGPMLWANGQVGREFFAQLVTAFFFLLVLFATSRISAIALAWGVLGVTIIRCLLITRVALKTVNAPWRRVLSPVRGSMVLLLLTGTVVFLSDHALQSLGVTASFRLLLNAVSGMIVFLSTLVMLPHLIFSAEMYWLGARISELLPPWMHRLKKRISVSAPMLT